MAQPTRWWAAELDPDQLCGEAIAGAGGARVPVSLAPDERTRALAGATVYAHGVPWGALEASLQPGDRILAGAYQRIEARLRVGTGVVHVMDAADAWDVRLCGLDALHARLQELQALVAGAGLEWSPSAAGVAALAIRALAERAHQARQGWRLRQLRPRWRTLAHEAVHPGPIAVCYGGGREPIVEVDRVAAFLRGLGTHLPIPGSWVAVGPWDRWSTVRRTEGDGLIRAVVQVEPLGWRSLGPLPQRIGRAQTWPCGHLVGTWTLRQLRDAEELGGVTVHRLIEGATCQVAPLLAPLADMLWALRERDARASRAIYTRAWGVLCSRGRWEGQRAEHDSRPPDLQRQGRPDSSLDWTAVRPQELDYPRQPPIYRPDWAAMVAVHNCRAMARATRAASGRLVAAHVDCLALRADAEGLRLVEELVATGEWALKAGPARGRWWAPGVAEHDGRSLRQGLPDWSALEVARAYRTGTAPRPGHGGQLWTRGGPARSRDAEARPAVTWAAPDWCDALQEGPTLGRRSVWSPRWTWSGWWGDPLEGEEEDERIRPQGWTPGAPAPAP